MKNRKKFDTITMPTAKPRITNNPAPQKYVVDDKRNEENEICD